MNVDENMPVRHQLIMKKTPFFMVSFLHFGAGNTLLAFQFNQPLSNCKSNKLALVVHP
jgi:hypothetical protein